jgi:hypothetical protein
MVSGSLSLPYSGFFSPFPHGTGTLSVSQEYLALPDGAGMFRQSFTGSALLESSVYFFHVRDFHPLWLDFPEYSIKNIQTLGLVRVRSPLLAESLLFSFPPGT